MSENIRILKTHNKSIQAQALRARLMPSVMYKEYHHMGVKKWEE